MTMPTIEARTRHAHRVKGKFAPRPAAYVQHLSDDAWPAASIKQLDELHMPPPPEAWPRKAAPPIDWDEFNAMHEHIERETWFSWRDWEWSDLWAVGFVGVVLAFGTHLAGLWGQ